MKEELLYFIWQLQHFDRQAVTTTQGESLTVLRPGYRNEHSGPDFAQARLHLDGIEWVGSVEIHVNASDWNSHGHQYDEAYNRVVLHVVWNNDRTVYRQDGTSIPTLVLSQRVAPHTLQNYQHLVFEASARRAIPCAPQLSHVDDLTKLSVLEKNAVLRLTRKSQEVAGRLTKNHGDWELTAYQTLVKSFGFRVNTAAFEQLSVAAPLSLINRYRRDFNTLVALLLGQAGLIDDCDWPDHWRETYAYLRTKHQLESTALTRSQWRFFRTRPANFPTVRIVQLARLLFACEGKPTRLFAPLPLEQLLTYFSSTRQETLGSVPSIGQESIHKILINAVVPYQFAYGEYFHEQSGKDRALSLLQALPPEKNQLASKYRKYGFSLTSAFDTQAVLELHQGSCEKKRCLSCMIGGCIVKNNKLFVTSDSH